MNPASMPPYTVVAPGSDRVGESPVWDAQADALWWVDIDSCRIKRWSRSTQQVQVWTLPERIGCLALADDGGLIAALEQRIVHAHPRPGGGLDLTDLAHITHPTHGMRFNDGRCDASGRLWVGTMVMDPARNLALGGFYTLDERGLTGPHIDALHTANGSAFSPDGRTLYVSDSHPLSQQIWVADLDLATGGLSARRPFVDMRPLPGRPDGAAVDAQGNYWICGNDAGQIHCFSPQGTLIRSHGVPFPKPSMCCFGGPGLSTLFVTSIVPADPTLDPGGLSGAVIAIECDTQGQPEPRFSRYPGKRR